MGIKIQLYEEWRAQIYEGDKHFGLSIFGQRQQTSRDRHTTQKVDLFTWKYIDIFYFVRFSSLAGPMRMTINRFGVLRSCSDSHGSLSLALLYCLPRPQYRTLKIINKTHTEFRFFHPTNIPLRILLSKRKIFYLLSVKWGFFSFNSETNMFFCSVFPENIRMLDVFYTEFYSRGIINFFRTFEYQKRPKT